MPPGRDPKYERWRWQIFAITWLAYAGFYLTRKAFSVAKNELKKPEVLGLSKGQLSSMDGAFSAAYAFGQFFWGALGDRFGARRVVLFGMMASIITCAWMGASKSALAMGILFTAQGLWQASGWAPLAKNMGAFFSVRERGSVLGFWCTNYALGGFIASIVAGFAAAQWGWRYAFFVPSAMLLGIWILFFFLQRNRPEDVGLPSIEEYHAADSNSTEPPAAPIEADAADRCGALREVAQNRMLWFLAAVYFLVKPTRYLLLFWSPVYIADRLGSNTLDSGLLSSMFDLAGPVGTLAGGILSDRLFASRRMPVCVIALGTLSILMIAFPYLPLTRVSMGIGMFLLGFLIYIPDSLIAGVSAVDFGTARAASTASGLINGCGSLGQMIGVTLPGTVQLMLGEGRDVWPTIFISLGISLAVAGALLAPHWNRVPKN
jgi:OPA family sugar phosphate sensor protein UhpC-like MFS transporter